MLRQFTSGIEHLEADLALVAATVMTSHFLQALEQLERRVDGPDRWRTVWRVSSRWSRTNE